MIPYDEFKALPVAERDAICAEKMGWSRSEKESVWVDATGRVTASVNGTSNRPFIGTGFWSPTTDRNDAAMMVEKAARDGVMRIKFTLMAHDLLAFETYGSAALAAVMADPCLIAYCACVALEGA